jgi:hypothetical protein
VTEIKSTGDHVPTQDERFARRCDSHIALSVAEELGAMAIAEARGLTWPTLRELSPWEQRGMRRQIRQDARLAINVALAHLRSDCPLADEGEAARLIAEHTQQDRQGTAGADSRRLERHLRLIKGNRA